MTLRIKRKDFLDFFIMSLLILEVMIIRWLNLVGGFNMLMIALLLMRYLCHLKRTVKDKSAWMYIAIIFYFFFNFYSLGGDYYTLFKNIFECASPLLIMLYFGRLMEEKARFLLGFFNGLFWPLNIYIVLNIPIIFLQMSGQYWLAGITSHMHMYHVDLISGLLGFNGTPVLALFSAFVIIYNNYYSMYCTASCYKKIIRAYNSLLLLCFSVISLFNDNKGFYLIMLMYILIYTFQCIEVKNTYKEFLVRVWRRTIQFLFFAILIVGSVIVLYAFTDIGTQIDKIVREFQIALLYGNKAEGSSERISMILYSLSSSNWSMGYGVGNYTWTTPYAFGFMHYGQSDVGTFMCLGGVIFIFLLSVLVLLMLQKVFRSRFFSVIMLCMFAVIGIYTQVFTVTSIMVCTMLFVATCWGVTVQTQNE